MKSKREKKTQQIRKNKQICSFIPLITNGVNSPRNYIDKETLFKKGSILLLHPKNTTYFIKDRQRQIKMMMKTYLKQ